MPFPNLGDEVFAVHVTTGETLFFQLAFNHDLRGDTGMVRTRNPSRVVALHTVETHERIHHRLVKGVTHVQNPRNVGRGQLHGKAGLRRIEFGLKVATLFPNGIPAFFDFRRFKALGKFFSHHFVLFFLNK